MITGKGYFYILITIILTIVAAYLLMSVGYEVVGKWWFVGELSVRESFAMWKAEPLKMLLGHIALFVDVAFMGLVKRETIY